MGIHPGPDHGDSSTSTSRNGSSNNGNGSKGSRPSLDASMPRCLDALLDDRDWLSIGRILGLSPQQREIARLIREEDLGNEAIALRLRTKLRCVETQLKRTYEKLGIRSRAALVDRVWVEFWAMRAYPGG